MKAAAAGDDDVAASVWPKAEQVFSHCPLSSPPDHHYVISEYALQIIAKVRRQKHNDIHPDL
jgi:hypothetical protein